MGPRSLFDHGGDPVGWSHAPEPRLPTVSEPLALCDGGRIPPSPITPADRPPELAVAP
jgi:hypothetical protein